MCVRGGVDGGCQNRQDLVQEIGAQGRDPLQSLTELKNGVSLSRVPASEKAARGKHIAGFVADESC